MSVTAIQIGLHPDHVAFGSPDFAMFPGLTAEKLQAAHDGNLAMLREAGYEVDGLQIDTGKTALEVVREAVRARPYDAVLLGAGIRLVPAMSVLSEQLTNLIHAEAPQARFVFNSGPRPSPEDIRRTFPDPGA